MGSDFSFYGSWDSRAPATFAKSDYGIRSGLSWTFGNRQQQSVDRFNSESFMTRITLPGIYFAKRLKWSAGFVGPWCSEHGMVEDVEVLCSHIEVEAVGEAEGASK